MMNKVVEKMLESFVRFRSFFNKDNVLKISVVSVIMMMLFSVVFIQPQKEKVNTDGEDKKDYYIYYAQSANEFYMIDDGKVTLMDMSMVNGLGITVLGTYEDEHGVTFTKIECRDVNFVTYEAKAFDIDGNVELVIEGENTFQSSYSSEKEEFIGIGAYGNLTISGTGILNVNTYNKKKTDNDNGTKKRTTAIYSSGVINIKSGTVISNAKGRNSIALCGNKSVNISGGKVELYAGDSGDNRGILGSEGISISGGDINIITESKDYWAYGISTTVTNTDKIDISGGKVSINVLGNTGESISNTCGAAIHSYKVDISGGDLDIDITGEKIWGIWTTLVDSNTTIKDNADVSIIGNVWGQYSEEGRETIYPSAIFAQSGYLYINSGNVKVNMSNKRDDYSITGLKALYMTINGGKIEANVDAKTNGIAIDASSYLTVNGGNIKAISNGRAIDNTTINLKTIDEHTQTNFIAVATDVKGRDIETYNPSNLANYKYVVLGTVYDYYLVFDATNGSITKTSSDGTAIDVLGLNEIPGIAVDETNSDTLVLSGFNFATTCMYALEIKGDAVIELDKKSCNGIYNNSSLGQIMGIYAYNSITFKGSGRLDIELYGGKAMMMMAMLTKGMTMSEDINLNIKVSMGETQSGMLMGIMCQDSGQLNEGKLTIDLYSASKMCEAAGIACSTQLTLNGTDIDINISSATVFAIQCFEIVINNGNININTNSAKAEDVFAQMGLTDEEIELAKDELLYNRQLLYAVEKMTINGGKVTLKEEAGDYVCGISVGYPPFAGDPATPGTYTQTGGIVKVELLGENSIGLCGFEGASSITIKDAGALEISATKVSDTVPTIDNNYIAVSQASLSTSAEYITPSDASSISSYDYVRIEPTYYLEFDSDTGKLINGIDNNVLTLQGYSAVLDTSTNLYKLVLDGFNFQTSNSTGLAMEWKNKNRIIEVKENSTNTIINNWMGSDNGFIGTSSITTPKKATMCMEGGLTFSGEGRLNLVYNKMKNDSSEAQGIYHYATGNINVNNTELNIKVDADYGIGINNSTGILYLTDSKVNINVGGKTVLGISSISNVNVDDAQLNVKINESTASSSYGIQVVSGDVNITNDSIVAMDVTSTSETEYKCGDATCYRDHMYSQYGIEASSYVKIIDSEVIFNMNAPNISGIYVGGELELDNAKVDFKNVNTSRSDSCIMYAVYNMAIKNNTMININMESTANDTYKCVDCDVDHIIGQNIIRCYYDISIQESVIDIDATASNLKGIVSDSKKIVIDQSIVNMPSFSATTQSSYGIKAYTGLDIINDSEIDMNFSSTEKSTYSSDNAYWYSYYQYPIFTYEQLNITSSDIYVNANVYCGSIICNGYDNSKLSIINSNVKLNIIGIYVSSIESYNYNGVEDRGQIEVLSSDIDIQMNEIKEHSEVVRPKFMGIRATSDDVTIKTSQDYSGRASTVHLNIQSSNGINTAVYANGNIVVDGAYVDIYSKGYECSGLWSVGTMSVSNVYSDKKAINIELDGADLESSNYGLYPLWSDDRAIYQSTYIYIDMNVVEDSIGSNSAGIYATANLDIDDTDIVLAVDSDAMCNGISTLKGYIQITDSSIDMSNYSTRTGTAIYSQNNGVTGYNINIDNSDINIDIEEKSTGNYGIWGIWTNGSDMDISNGSNVNVKLDVYSNGSGVYSNNNLIISESYVNVDNNVTTYDITYGSYAVSAKNNITTKGSEVIAKCGYQAISGKLIFDKVNYPQYDVILSSTDYAGNMIENYDETKLTSYKNMVIGRSEDYAYKYYAGNKKVYAHGSNSELTTEQLANIGLEVDATSGLLTLIGSDKEEETNAIELTSSKEVALWIIGDANIAIKNNTVYDIVSNGDTGSNYSAIKGMGNIYITGDGTINCNKTSVSSGDENYYGIYSMKDIFFTKGELNIHTSNAATTGNTTGVYAMNVYTKGGDTKVEVDADGTAVYGIECEGNYNSIAGRLNIVLDKANTYATGLKCGELINTYDGTLEVAAATVMNKQPTINTARVSISEARKGTTITRPGDVTKIAEYDYVRIEPHYSLRYENNKMYINDTDELADVTNWRVNESGNLVLDGFVFTTSSTHGINAYTATVIEIADKYTSSLYHNYTGTANNLTVHVHGNLTIKGTGKLKINSKYSPEVNTSIYSTENLSVQNAYIELDIKTGQYTGLISQKKLTLDKAKVDFKNVEISKNDSSFINSKSGMDIINNSDIDMNFTSLENTLNQYGEYNYAQLPIYVDDGDLYVSNSNIDVIADAYCVYFIDTFNGNVTIDDSAVINMDVKVDVMEGIYAHDYQYDQNRGLMNISGSSTIHIVSEPKTTDKNIHTYAYVIDAYNNLNISENSNIYIELEENYSSYDVIYSDEIMTFNDVDIDIYGKKSKSTVTSNGIFGYGGVVITNTTDLYIDIKGENIRGINSYEDMEVTDSAINMYLDGGIVCGADVSGNVDIQENSIVNTDMKGTEESRYYCEDCEEEHSVPQAIILSYGNTSITGSIVTGIVDTTDCLGLHSHGEVTLNDSSVIFSDVKTSSYDSNLIYAGTGLEIINDSYVYAKFESTASDTIVESDGIERIYPQNIITSYNSSINIDNSDVYIEADAYRVNAIETSKGSISINNGAVVDIDIDSDAGLAIGVQDDTDEELLESAGNVNISSSQVDITMKPKSDTQVELAKGQEVIVSDCKDVVITDGSVLNIDATTNTETKGIYSKLGNITISNNVDLNMNLESTLTSKGLVTDEANKNINVTSSTLDIYAGDNEDASVAIVTDNLVVSGETEEMATIILEASKVYKDITKDEYTNEELIKYPGKNDLSYKYIKIGEIPSYYYQYDADYGVLKKVTKNKLSTNVPESMSDVLYVSTVDGVSTLNINGLDFTTIAGYGLEIKGSDAKVNISGTNSITNIYDSRSELMDMDEFKSVFGIYIHNAVDITSDGSMNLNGVDKETSTENLDSLKGYVGMGGYYGGEIIDIDGGVYVIKTDPIHASMGIIASKVNIKDATVDIKNSTSFYAVGMVITDDSDTAQEALRIDNSDIDIEITSTKEYGEIEEIYGIVYEVANDNVIFNDSDITIDIDACSGQGILGFGEELNIKNNSVVIINVNADIFGIGIMTYSDLNIDKSTVKIGANGEIDASALYGDTSDYYTFDINGKVDVSTEYLSGDVTDDMLTTVTDINTNYEGYKYIKIVPSVISVDISWGAMDYKYNRGTWNTSALKYDNGGWVLKDETDIDGGKITVDNHSNVPIDATIEYKELDAYSHIKGSVQSSMNNTTIVNKVTESVAASTGVLSKFIVLVGEPTSEMDSAKIGGITITLEE